MNRPMYTATESGNTPAPEKRNTIGIQKSECAAFSGYRAYKFAKIFPDGTAEQHIKTMLRPVIAEEYRKGIRIFYTGMASGFDLWSADTVLELRACGICPQAQLITVEPYSGHGNSIRMPHERKLYEKILHESQINIILSDRYYDGCYLKRNDYMLENAGEVICYYDGQKGGTRYTINHAQYKGLKVINIFAPEIFAE